jgi:hypothetical protein
MLMSSSLVHLVMSEGEFSRGPLDFNRFEYFDFNSSIFYFFSLAIWASSSLERISDLRSCLLRSLLAPLLPFRGFTVVVDCMPLMTDPGAFGGNYEGRFSCLSC